MKRYQRNIGTITTNEQEVLHKKKVLVVGLGGLGGIVVEGLARMGIKQIGICDKDFFDESNLNRQLLATEKTLGKSKVLIARERILSIDNSINLTLYEEGFPSEKLLLDFNLFDVVIDCVDNHNSRLLLEEKCVEFKIPLIHGAIAGLFGKLAVISSENMLIKFLPQNGNGIEKTLGNPFYTPAIVGSMEVLLCVKVLLNHSYLKKGFYYIDLETFSMEEIIVE